MVDVADARILYCREPEARADGPIIVEAPPADIPIPSRLQLAHQNRLSPLAVYRNAPKVPGIRPGFKDGLCGGLGPANSLGHVCPVCLDPAFLEQPVAERAASISIVLHVEYRGVSVEVHELATIPHVLELDAGCV